MTPKFIIQARAWISLILKCKRENFKIHKLQLLHHIDRKHECQMQSLKNHRKIPTTFNLENWKEIKEGQLMIRNKIPIRLRGIMKDAKKPQTHQSIQLQHYFLLFQMKRNIVMDKWNKLIRHKAKWATIQSH